MSGRSQPIYAVTYGSRVAFNPLPSVTLAKNQVFGEQSPAEPYLEIQEWDQNILYFVGRNGSGKSRAGRALAEQLGGTYLGADRLTGVMSFSTYDFGAMPREFRGVSMEEQGRKQMRQMLGRQTNAAEALLRVNDEPEVWLRVAAFIRRVLGRSVELTMSAGFLDPRVRVGEAEFSLLRDEGHGLRELVVLLATTYARDWNLLVVDEPELHLHPAMARLWLSELESICVEENRHAVVITHQPDLVNASDSSHLRALWLFQQGRTPKRVFDAVLPQQRDRVTASLRAQPRLVSQLVFSPRPVLLEGTTDVAALSTALSRLALPSVVSQTDLVECGGRGAVAMWFEIARTLGLDVRAVADLDAALATEVQRTMDSIPEVIDAYRTRLMAEPPRTHVVVRPLIAAADEASVTANEAARAAWLASGAVANTGHAERLAGILEVWRSVGLWLHPEGDLELVLGISRDSKSVDRCRAAAGVPSALDSVARWCAYDLDTAADVFSLLSQAAERVAHEVMEAQRLEPLLRVNAPIGTNSEADSRIFLVESGITLGTHRVTVRGVTEFDGHWMEFSRDTAASELLLRPAVAEPNSGQGDDLGSTSRHDASS